MKNKIITTLVVLSIVSLIVTGLWNGVSLNSLQKEILLVLVIICGSSASYCFIVGEITRNNSQMDKLWSIMPIVYVWVIAIMGGMSARLIVMAILVSIWGVRLTINFAKKGAYSIKFWSGVEDYRWSVLRKNKMLKSPFAWALFDLFFISITQNAIVLAITLPALAVVPSSLSFGVIDYVAAVLTLFFIIYETLGDIGQSHFQSEKYRLLGEGKKLEDLPNPWNMGFNTVGLWSYSRHPNYAGEQGTWLSFYLFVIGAGVTHFAIFNWSMTGCLVLVLLFIGSSSMSEGISASKYKGYSLYQRSVPKYIPLFWKKYSGDKQ